MDLGLLPDLFARRGADDVPGVRFAEPLRTGRPHRGAGRGFRGLPHRPLDAGSHVAAWRDFTGGDETAFFDDATDHGTRVCTNLGGRSGDTIRGLAWGAEYYLAKTDRAEVEPRAEERQLIRGIEWLLAHDVDVISSSLGYTTFDDFSGYTPAMLDGRTSTLSRYLDSLLTARPGSFSCRAPATRATRRGAMSPFRPMSGRSSRSVRAIPTVFPAPAPVVSDAKMPAM